MRKKCTFLLPLVLLVCAIAISQERGKKIPLLHSQSKKATFVKRQAGSKKGTLSQSSTLAVSAQACSPDTILYPYLKELTFSAPNDSFFIDAMVGDVRTASQAYHLNQSATIKGIQFWGAAYTTDPHWHQPLPVTLILSAVDGNNMPTTELATSSVIIAEEYGFYYALFETPIEVNGNFAVSVKSAVNDTLAVITNNAGSGFNPTNYGEGLAWRKFGSGTWNSSISFFGQDLEYMIFPIVEYTVTPDFNGNTSTVEGTTETFTNSSTTSSPIYGNRMFNLNAFDKFWNLKAEDETFSWDYGDGSDKDIAFDGSHAYTTAGNYSVTLEGTMRGYYTTCTQTKVASITVAALDSDGDGVNDDVDNCPSIANANQTDTDTDGVGDACDTDDDGDGITDAQDNCPLIANVNQLDTDSDSYGDACDSDDDNDGIADNLDKCPLVADLSQTDTDGDGTGNACDADDDGDGVTDAQDCNPLNATVYAGASELCDGLDNDCDGYIDEGCAGKPNISINDIVVYETQGMARLTVKLSKLSTTDVKVYFTTVDGTAKSKSTRTAQKDFSAVSGNLIIRAGYISGTISVPIISDGVSESDEGFEVRLTKPVNATITDDKGLVTIKDGLPPSLTRMQTAANQEEVSGGGLNVQLLPNPFKDQVTLRVRSALNQPINVQVVDAVGRIVEGRSGVAANSTLRVGLSYRPGVYFAQVMQGGKMVTVKLIKQAY